LFFVVILNEGCAAGPVKDQCILSLFLFLPVLKSVLSVRIRVKPSVLNGRQNSTLTPSCTCLSGDCPVDAAVNVPNGRTFNPSAATVAAF
jgi:hypothetical protein